MRHIVDQRVGGGVGARVEVMKVLSYNVRGLGGVEKRMEVRRLVQEKQPRVLCIQESKVTNVDDNWIKAI